MEKDFPLGQAQGRILIGWVWIRYPSLDQSLWPTWSHMSNLWRRVGSARRRKKRDTELTEQITPQAQNCCSHGNEPGAGSTQGGSLWPGGLKSVSSASERRSGPSPPAPHLSGFYYFLVPGIYLTSKKNTTVTCTCRIFNQYTTVHVKKHIAL